MAWSGLTKRGWTGWSVDPLIPTDRHRHHIVMMVLDTCDEECTSGDVNEEAVEIAWKALLTALGVRETLDVSSRN